MPLPLEGVGHPPQKLSHRQSPTEQWGAPGALHNLPATLHQSSGQAEQLPQPASKSDRQHVEQGQQPWRLCYPMFRAQSLGSNPSLGFALGDLGQVTESTSWG